MALKKFMDLYKIDLSKHIQKKPTFYRDKNTKQLIETSKDKLEEILKIGIVNTENIDDAINNLFKEIGSYLLHVSLASRRERTLRIE